MQEHTKRTVYMLLSEIFNTATQEGKDREHAFGYIAGIASAAQLIMDTEEGEGGGFAE